MVEIDYTKVAKVLRGVLLERSPISIKELYELSEFNSLNYENFTALLKLLIKYNCIFVVDDKAKKFKNWIVELNTDMQALDFLESLLSKKFTFKDTRICITLPRFNIFGLTDFLTSQKIELYSLLDEFKSLFKDAKKVIRICSPFIEWNGFAYFKDLLLKKAQQGVKIRILGRQLRPKERDSRYNDVKKIFENFRLRNLDSLVEFRNYFFLTEDKKLASSIHAKLIVIDETRAYLGSGEIRENSFKKNLEIGVILTGEKVKELIKIFDGVYNKSEVLFFE